MPRRTLLVLALSACCALMLACAAADNANTTNTTNASNANRAATNAASTNTTPAAATSPAAAAAGDKIGVAECDDFIAKYDDCVSRHVPEAARAQYKTTLEQWRKSWRDLAANPQTRSSLAQACKQSADTARQSLAAYNCSF